MTSIIYYTVYSAWLCYYAGNHQFNYMWFDHQKGPFVVSSQRLSSPANPWPKGRMENPVSKLVENCDFLDIVWLPDESEWWERTRAEIEKKRELEEK